MNLNSDYLMIYNGGRCYEYSNIAVRRSRITRRSGYPKAVYPGIGEDAGYLLPGNAAYPSADRYGTDCCRG